MRFFGKLIAGFLLVCLAASSSYAAGEAASSSADFNAQIQYRVGEKPSHVCGTASSVQNFARMDVDLRKTGRLSILVDMRAGRMQAVAHTLKAYAEIPVTGDPRNWRDLLKSISSVLMPQSLGMVGLVEKETKYLGKASWQGFSARKSRVVFEASFMGKNRTFPLEVWESSVFAPFPLRIIAPETKETYGGSAWLSNIEATENSEQFFKVPEGYTRYPSVMDLFLYALTAF